MPTPTKNINAEKIQGDLSIDNITASTISAATYQNLPSSPITIGTTSIVSGAEGRILFQSTGNTAQQDSQLFWDNTNKRLGIGKTPAASSAKVVVAITDGTANQNFYLTLRNLAAGYGSWGFVKLGSNDLGINYQTDSDVPQTGTSMRFYYGGQIGITSSVSIGNIGTPSARLDVRAQGALSTDIAFRVRNSADSANLASIAGNGAVTFNGASGTAFTPIFAVNRGVSEVIRVDEYKTQITGDLYVSSIRAITTSNIQFLNQSGAGGYLTMQPQFGNLILGAGAAGTSATNTTIFTNGTAPSSSPTDVFQLYSADITAGNAAPHFRTENGSIIKLYQETTGVTASTLVGGGGTTITDTDTFDGYTLQQVVKALKNLGILQ